MPKLGRPFVNLENDLTESSRDKRRYMFDEGSEVTRNAPFGTTYTPRLFTKIVGSKYKKFQRNVHGLEQNDSVDMDTKRSEMVSPTKDCLNKRPILPPIYNESQREYDLSELIGLLPAGMVLPHKTIQLNNNEQLSLLKLIKYEIRLLPDFINKLKQLYLMLAKIDFNLTGLCSFKEFVDASYQNNVHLSWKLFRIIASQFVVPNRDDVSFVHYEKIISFVGAVYRSLDPSERNIENIATMKDQHVESSNEQAVYYHDDYCIDIDKHEKSVEDTFDVDDTKIIKQISDEVGVFPIPLQRIRLACQRTDGLHRGTLSAKQIWDIFQSEGLMLRQDTFNRIMHRCKYMGGGQYSWLKLMEFLERIQPISTGLQIPSSKMPIDFVKPIPAPASSWPHSEAFDLHHDLSESRMSTQPMHGNHTPRSQDFSQQHSVKPIGRTEHNVALNSVRSSVSNPPSSPRVEPWFNRFLKFVDSIYIKDVNSQGILPTRELYDISCQLNEQLGLNLSTTEVISALEGAAVDNDRLYSNINSYLKRLAIR